MGKQASTFCGSGYYIGTHQFPCADTVRKNMQKLGTRLTHASC